MGIQLTKNTFENILALFRNTNEKTEIECKIDGMNSKGVGKIIYYSQFQRVLNYIQKAFYPLKLFTNEVQLDIHVGQYRMSLIGSENIMFFCKNKGIISQNVGTSIFVMTKTRIGKESINEYDISMKTSEESKLEGQVLHETIAFILSEKNHIYRIKNRYSMILPKSNLRLDLTLVKSNVRPAESLMECISHMKQNYEIEIEVINPLQIRKGKEGDIVLEMISLMTELLKVVDDVEYLIGKTERENVLKDYIKLAFNPGPTVPINLQDPKRWFVGPQPVTFEKKHMLSPTEYPISIYAGYTVTLKADGERHLLYIHSNGKVYLINSRLLIKYTGLTFLEYKDSIFDAELITTLYSKKKIILLFDVYYVRGIVTASFPLVSTGLKKNEVKKKGRLETIAEFVSWASHKMDKTDENILYSMEAKEFLYPQKNKSSIHDIVKQLFQKKLSHDVNFKVDGIIFTPMYLPVGVDFKVNESSEILQEKPAILGKTWNSVMKWKPLEHNTIDFLIREIPGMSIYKDGHNYRKFALYYSNMVTPFDSTMKFLKSYPKLYQKSFVRELFDAPVVYNESGEIEIDPRYMWIKENENGIMIDNDGNQILSDSILEVSFDPLNKKWIPSRVRVDKNETYKMSGSIANTANSYKVCHSVWKTIMDPITADHLIGKVKLNMENIDMNDSYYDMDNTEKRSDTLTFPMKTFHSRWVKDQSLISCFKGKVRSLMDPAFGRGGDLRKYIDAKIPIVLGTDLSSQNIYDSRDGANKRLQKAMQNKSIQHGWKYVFVPMDYSIPIERSLMKKGEDTTLLRVLWGKQNDDHPRIKRLEGMASKRFDVLSMQFALHYFFENNHTMKACLDNICSQLKNGGYFIGTCFDGELIDQMFQDNEINFNELKEGRKRQKDKEKETLIWSIRKKYNKDYDPSNSVGYKIGVMVETINNRENDEFLVGFDLLVKELKKRNIRLLSQSEAKTLGLSREKSHGSFEELFDDMIDFHSSMDDSDKINMGWIKDAMYMSPAEKELSFLYKWFVFRKDNGGL